MKKIFVCLLCTLMLASCEQANQPQVPQQGEQTPAPDAIKTMIAASEVAPVAEGWTVLGEVGIVIDGEYTDIVLATSAERGNDGYMMWDDSQQWRLVALGENSSYSLLDERLSGISYLDVTMEGEVPSVKLISTSTMGLSVTEYTFSDGAFYAEKLIWPESDSNRIYNSFPEYFE